MKIKVLYEDNNVLAIDKPAGVLVHPDGRKDPSTKLSTGKTILEIFQKKYPKLEIVHRLDRETSGVLLLAKNKKTYEFLKQQFMNRTVKKVYNAIVHGFVKNDHGVINKPIGRSPRDFRRHLAGRGARGEMRDAVTEYLVLKRFVDATNEFTYLEVKPQTGRTHQIRVHMKYTNHPIVEDKLYNPRGLPLPNLPLAKGKEKGGGRMMLHAKSIEFKNLRGKMVKVESPLPKEFQKILNHRN